MRVRVIRVIEIIGEETIVNWVLRESFMQPNKKYQFSKYEAKEIIRFKENYRRHKVEDNHDNQRV